MNDDPESRPAGGLSHVLRRLRAERGLTLAEISRRTGLPVSSISKAENGKIALTYDKLLRFAEALDVDISRLFTGAAPADAAPPGSGTGRRSVSLSGQGLRIESDNYRHVYPVADLLHRRFIPIVVELLARSMAEFGDFVRHSGEEYSYVLEGELELHTTLYKPLRLKAGDSVYFDSTMGHAYIAVGAAPCRLLCICSAEAAAAAERMSGQVPPSR